MTITIDIKIIKEKRLYKFFFIGSLIYNGRILQWLIQKSPFIKCIMSFFIFK